ncbi:MAG: cytochrome c3 family protein [Candidatus Kapaibacteriales bacterium]
MRKPYTKFIVTLSLIFFSFNILLLFTLLRSGIGFSPRHNQSFSHKTHSGKFSITCLFCHHQAETSSYANIPTTSLCVQCHIALKSDSPLLSSILLSYDSLVSLRWEKVYNLPDYVRFDHRAHIYSGIDCSTCHGFVDDMDTVYVVRKLTMGWCIDCHNNPTRYAIPPRKISGLFYIPKFLDVDSLPLKLNKLQPASVLCSKCHY